MRLFLSDFLRHFPALAAIIAVAAALRVYFFGGYIGLDDGEYTRFAYQMAQDQFSINGYSGPAVFPLRIGVIFPASLTFRFFGFGEWSVVVYPFVISVLALLLSYICASALFSHRVGLIAAAFHAVLPLDVNSATVLLPDLAAAFYASLGVTAIVLLLRFPLENQAAVFTVGVCAGLAFGVSWLCKETVSYFALTCAVLIGTSLKRSPKSGTILLAGVTLGSLAVLLGEMIVYGNLTGDFMLRFHEIERNYRQWENSFFTEGSDFGWPKGSSRAVALIKRLFISGPTFLFLNSYFLFLPLVGLVAAIHAAYWKDRSFLIPSVWFITLFLMFNFSSSSVASYSPLPLFERYFYPILFPSIVLASALLGKLMFQDQSVAREIRRERSFWGVLVITLLLIFGGPYVYWGYRTPLTWTHEVRDIVHIVKPSSPFYSDILTLRMLEFFSGYPVQTSWIDFESINSTGELKPGSMVMVNKRYIAWLDKNGGMWLSKRSGYRKHEFYDHPPQTWRRIYESSNAVLYQLS